MRDAWTDERLDDLNGKVDEGFNRVNADLRASRTATKTEILELRSEMNERFDRVDRRFEGIDHRFDSMQRTLVISFGGITAGLLGVIASIVATGGA